MPALAATAAVPSRVAHAATGAAGLQRSSFVPCVGDEFVFEKGAFEQCVATLRSVEGFQHAGRRVEGEGQFSLRFDVRAGLAQESYRVSHPRLGRFILFVSPTGGSEKVVEAVFNRL